MISTVVYQEVRERVKRGEKFLDLGCCFGQEIRKLVFDGAPSINTYGSDLWGDFLSIGYELFKDKDRLQTTFIAADVFDDTSELTTLADQMNIIYTGAFFHLFNLEEQEKIALRIVQLLVPQPGSLIIGRQSGSENPGEFSRSGDKNARKHFRHNAQSWKELWDRVGEKTGSKWLVEADLLFPEFTMSAPEGESTAMRSKMETKGLRYTIRRQ
jgi:SAM-dependent methyltransferase